MNSTNQIKFFLLWFAIFLPTLLIAMSTQKDFFIQLCWFLLMALGLIMLSDILSDAYYSWLSTSWPSTLFTVKNSEVIYSTGDSDSGPHYRTYFEIEYQVNRIKYNLPCHELNIPHHQTEAEANSFIKDVVSGAKGDRVYYHPEQPYIAYIKTGVKFRHLLGVLVALALILVPLLSFFKVIIWR